MLSFVMLTISALVVERNVPSLVCEWCWVRLSPLQLWWQWLCVIWAGGSGL